jgi:hypothetical protein
MGPKRDCNGKFIGEHPLESKEKEPLSTAPKKEIEKEDVSEKPKTKRKSGSSSESSNGIQSDIYCTFENFKKELSKQPSFVQYLMLKELLNSADEETTLMLSRKKTVQFE